ncbi:unnamed protein product [Callosobruchus maculatus]|uniref:Uncharacterized protein n=1 Tax=Callosobruchus maculatus TaxID=64391 RepID=A0A653CEE8_CALMS|nr:unnamed protein product [Callosobruchus maculatus]
MLYAKNVLVVLFLLSVVLAGIDARTMQDKCKSDDDCKQFQYLCAVGGNRYNKVVKMRCYVNGRCHCRLVKKT